MEIRKILNTIDHPRIFKIPTTYVLTMDDGPLAVKRHPDASMVKAISDCVPVKTRELSVPDLRLHCFLAA
jgi:fatty acid/phospholipid biosynthesis enzyme